MRAAIVSVVLALAVAACGADEQSADPAATPPPPEQAAAVAPPPAPEPPPPAAAAARDRRRAPASRRLPPLSLPPAPPRLPCPAGTVRAVGDDTARVCGRRQTKLVAYREPGGDAFARFGTRNANGHVMVFRSAASSRTTAGCSGTTRRCRCARTASPASSRRRRSHVQRRNTKHRYRSVAAGVDVLIRDGEARSSRRPRIGAPSTPTPTGRFYVNQRLIAPDPDGPWGPGALGISAFSDVLQEWIQGGPIGIHGTNDPSSIGRAASHGCVRLPNDVLMKVFNTADAGTPVIIQPDEEVIA